jgi:hypothetical protein
MASKLNYLSSGSELPYTTITRSQTTFRSTTFVRVFKYLIICSIALALSVFFPTPWSPLRARTFFTKVPLQTTTTDSASQWKDDIWPLRPQTPWDISTDFQYPRRLEYDVSEGTWLRLDVHPKSGDIVFDMVGDLYCLSAKDVAKQTSTTGVARARPILLGVPFDSDPHFSPFGDRLVFRSDAELGIENIWVMEWKGCESMDIRSQDNEDEMLSKALALKQSEEDMLAAGIKETPGRKHRRLLREGRLGGILSPKFSVFDSSCYVISSPRYQRDLPLGFRPALSPIWFKNNRHEMVHFSSLPWCWRRLGVCCSFSSRSPIREAEETGQGR